MPSAPPGKIEDFDRITEYVISKEEFKSWNNDVAFKKNGLNAFYFKYQKPHKVEVEFIGSAFGVVDIVLWDPNHPQFEISPIVLHRAFPASQTMKYYFYANPFFLNRTIGYFEPRVYSGWHTISGVRVTKLLTFKTNKECEYTLFLLKRANDFLNFAKTKYEAADYGLAVHFSRFAIEFALKGMYTVFGMTFEKEHEIEFSKNLRQRIRKTVPNLPLSRLLWICKQHASPPRVDFYGDELGFTPSYSFIDETEARTAITNANHCYIWSASLLDNVQKA